MADIVPTQTVAIPVHPGTEGYNTLQLVVSRYEFAAATQPSSKRVALLWSHANGFHKESHHALMRRVIAAMRKNPAYDGIDLHMYAWDSRNHGDSARLNDGQLTETFNWFDNAMDTKQVVETLNLQDYDLLIGIGHSFGASSMILCEFFYPKTFDGLCLLEPVIPSALGDMEFREEFPEIAKAKKRRDEWPTRDECRKTFLQRGRFWKGVVPEVFENYIKFALYDTPEGTVKLKCPRRQEFLVYMNGFYPSVTSFHALKLLSIPAHVILAKKSSFLLPGLFKAVSGMSPLIDAELVEGSHMVPLEDPDALVPGILKLFERTQSASKKAKL